MNFELIFIDYTPTNKMSISKVFSFKSTHFLISFKLDTWNFHFGPVLNSQNVIFDGTIIFKIVKIWHWAFKRSVYVWVPVINRYLCKKWHSSSFFWEFSIIQPKGQTHIQDWNNERHVWKEVLDNVRRSEGHNLRDPKSLFIEPGRPYIWHDEQRACATVRSRSLSIAL